MGEEEAGAVPAAVLLVGAVDEEGEAVGAQEFGVVGVGGDVPEDGLEGVGGRKVGGEEGAVDVGEGELSPFLSELEKRVAEN